MPITRHKPGAVTHNKQLCSLACRTKTPPTPALTDATMPHPLSVAHQTTHAVPHTTKNTRFSSMNRRLAHRVA